MSKIKELLKQTDHLPWKMPEEKWQFYQEWKDALFLHFEVNFEALRALVPKDFNLDNFEGKYYISLVAFKMQNIRPRGLPAVSFISDFHEINVRTYIENDGKKGVYFINIEAEKALSAFVSKKLSQLPYEKSDMIRTSDVYFNLNRKKGFELKCHFEKGQIISQKANLEIWLTERYCLYQTKDELPMRTEIQHKEWDLFEIKIEDLTLSYPLSKELTLDKSNLIAYQYSPGVEIVSWKSNKL